MYVVANYARVQLEKVSRLTPTAGDVYEFEMGV